MFFDPEIVTVMIGRGSTQLKLAYRDTTSLRIAGRGDVVTKSAGGWVGGGFGLSGMIKGAVEAQILNALTTTTQHQIETIIHFDWNSGSVTLLNTQLLPARWATLLLPVFQRIEAAQQQPMPIAEQEDLAESDSKLCPYCAETIKAAAIKCRYCGSSLS